MPQSPDGSRERWTPGVCFPGGKGISSLLHIVQTGSGTQPACNPFGIGVLFPWKQSGRGVKLTTHLRLVPSLRMVDLYIHSPKRLQAWSLII
jgi:hypothetical protein